MTAPTPAETEAFLERLRDQASFLQDPAILDAVAFIERLVAATEAPDADAISTELETSKRSPPLKNAA